jgi:hypothetical protein
VIWTILWQSSKASKKSTWDYNFGKLRGTKVQYAGRLHHHGFGLCALPYQIQTQYIVYELRLTGAEPKYSCLEWLFAKDDSQKGIYEKLFPCTLVIPHSWLSQAIDVKIHFLLICVQKFTTHSDHRARKTTRRLQLMVCFVGKSHLQCLVKCGVEVSYI